MGLTITLILAGIILILAELLLIPGVGVAGILGVLSICGASWYAFAVLGPLTGAIVIELVKAGVHGATSPSKSSLP